MKAYLALTLLTISISFCGLNAQIPITIVAQQTDIETPNKDDSYNKYDSLENYLGRNVNKYIGQVLYLRGQSKGMREHGYFNFYTTNGCGLYGEESYLTKPYKQHESDVNTPYDEIAGKYFEVLDVLPHPDIKYYKGTIEALKDIKIISGKENNQSKKLSNDIKRKLKLIDSNFFFDNKCFLRLLEKSSNEELYYEYDAKSKSSYSYPFIIVGYFEKLQRQLKGKEYVIADYLLNTSKDIETGKPIINRTGQIWRCVNLSIEDEYFDIAPVMQDSNGQKTIIPPFLRWKGGSVTGKIFDVEEANELRNKFGNDAYDFILQRKVFVGMTKEMLLIEEGKPDKITKVKKANTDIEHWFYYDTNCYFENGILKSINPSAAAKKNSIDKKK